MILKKQQMMVVGVIVIVLLSVVVILVLDNEGFFGDEYYASYPVMSRGDFEILDTAYVDFEDLKQTMSAVDARQQLLFSLNETAGVVKTELGVDGYTIFITYADGGFAAVDTFDLDEVLSSTAEGNEADYLFMGGYRM
ncbi:MAG: hypothetical protein KKC68_00515 [Candidatus Thermoplasmatota archaeon]|nr:hypothetical protein [Candidatus Thermoplasmatota archaeon]